MIQRAEQEGTELVRVQEEDRVAGTPCAKERRRAMRVEAGQVPWGGPQSTSLALTDMAS